MNTKRQTLKLQILTTLLAILAATFFVSCGDDEPDKNNPLEYGSMINKSYDITYSVKAIDENVLRDIADLQIEYIDAEGALHLDTITEATWTKDCLFELTESSHFGLKARWLFRDKDEIQRLVDAENQRPDNMKTTYNLYIDITSPYITVKTDDTRISSVFKSLRSPNMENKDLSAAAILNTKLDKQVFTEWYWKVVKENDFLKMSSEAFPKHNVSFSVDYTVKVTGPKMLRDIADLEITYTDDNQATQTITLTATDSPTYKTTCIFRNVGDVVSLRAEWKPRTQFPDVATNGLATYNPSVDLTSPVGIVHSDATTSSTSLQHSFSFGNISLQDIVNNPSVANISANYVYRVTSSGGQLQLEQIDK